MAIDPKDLVFTELRSGGGRLGRVVLDGRFALAAGDACFATTDGARLHRREAPGQTFALAVIDGRIYSCGGPLAVSADRGTTWTEIAVPFNGYRFAIFRDSRGTWWLGCDRGVVLTSSRPDGGWEPASFKLPGKVLHITEYDGLVYFAGGGGGGTWNGTAFRELDGFGASHVVTRITRGPSGAFAAIGDGGIAFRSDDGHRWSPVDSGVKQDLEDCAWIAGALFVVGGRGHVLRSVNEGRTYTQIGSGTLAKMWGMVSWGDGAFVVGDNGRWWKVAAPGDPYWNGATDELAPPPPAIDPQFTPRAARPADEREAEHSQLLATALVTSEAAGAELRAARAPDPHPDLARLVEEAPDDDVTAAQVYADRLLESGDRRGELAAIQAKLAAAPHDKELAAAAAALLADRPGRWVGNLAPYPDLVELVWRAGFIRAARLALTHDRFNDSKNEVALDEVLEILLDEPCARFLRELTVGIVTFDDNNYASIAAKIGARYLPTLRGLFLGDFHSEETELNWSNLGDIEPIYAATPNLRLLKVRSGSIALGTIVLPRLEAFEVITGGLDHAAARSIATATWPGLRVLSIQVGPEGRAGADASAEDFQPILDAVGLPRLTQLGLTNLDYTDALIEPLARSRILPQLEQLDLQMGTLSDDGARLIYRYQRAFAHLKKINVDDCFLTDDGQALLASTGIPFHFGDQRDDDGDPGERYASAYE